MYLQEETFLKSDSVELRHIINEFQRISIAHCDLNISLNHNKSEIFSLSKSSIHLRIKIFLEEKLKRI